MTDHQSRIDQLISELRSRLTKIAFHEHERYIPETDFDEIIARYQ